MLVLILALGSTSIAQADGFKCVGQNTGLNINVFNHTDPSDGTRSPAVMVVSDPMIGSPNKTIAKFSSDNRNLDYLGYGKYSAKVDLRFNDSGRQGENIAGTKLGQLATIVLAIEFAYNQNTTDLARAVAEIPGKISYNKRNGEVLEEAVACTRYLKN